MAAGRETREVAMKDIARTLSKHGPGYDLHRLKDRKYTDVATSTWLRWVAKVKDSGAPARQAAKRIKNHVAQRAKQPDPAASVTAAVTEQLPAVVKPDDVAYTGIIPAMDRIKECMDDANRVKEFCRTENGRIRNPKLFLTASKHMLVSLRTAASIASQLMDAQRVEQFHQAIIDELETMDPVFIERVLDRLEQINRAWGASV